MARPIGAYLDDLQAFQDYTIHLETATSVLMAVAHLGVLDPLDDGPASADEVAARLGLRCEGVTRVLRYLQAQGVIGRDGDGRYRATERSRLLQQYRAGPLFLREAIGAGLGLAESLQSGRPGFDHTFGKPIFEYLTEHPEAFEYFGALMARTTRLLTRFVFSNHAFEPFGLAVDVGGSHGDLMMALLAEYPDARGIVFDRPETARQAAARVADSAVAERIEAVGGDFFEAVPGGADLYLLKQILHDWSDEDCVRILRSVRAVMPDGGRLAVIEFLLPEENIEHQAFDFDILMLLLTDGKERRLSEFEALFEASGFRLDRQTDNARGQSVIEAVPV